MKKYILLPFFLSVFVFAYSQSNEQKLRSDLNLVLQLIGQNLPNDYQRIANSDSQSYKDYDSFQSIAIVRENKISQITLRFTNNIERTFEIYPRFMSFFNMLTNMGTYIGDDDKYICFKLPNNRYALIENTRIDRNEF